MRRTKKFAIAILMALMACLCMFGFVGCNGEYLGNRDQLEKDHVHSWGEYVVTTEATCETSGVKTRTCTNPKCGATDSEVIVIDALGHDYGEAVVTTAPTCTAAGVEAKTCARCSKTTTESIEKLGHDLTKVDAVAATCVDEGNVEYYACAVCEKNFEDPNGATVLETVVIAALGHDDAKVATCTEAAVCSRCGTYGEALGHLEEEVEGYAATCTTDGLTDGVKCVRCGDAEHIHWLEAQEVIPAFGHTETVAATCKKPAYCGVCNNYYDKVRDHKIVTVEAKAPTCEEDGYKAYSKCGYGDCDYVTEITVVAATGHINVTAVAEVPATCTATGVAAYDQCACGKKVVDGVVKTDAELVLAALGHANVTDATCTEKAVCSRCGEYGEALGHNVVVDDEVAATCTVDGKKQWAHCTRCTYSIGGETIPALGHDEVDNEAKAATCTEIGWDAYKTCSRCDYSTKVENAALGHTGNTVEAKAPTCTESGWAAYEYCQRCDYTTFKHVEALGHDEVEHEAQAATCTEIGWEAYVTCSRCDYTTYAEVAATGHTLKSTIYKAATCTATGNVAYKTCETCEGIFVYVDSVLTETTLEAVTIPKKPHNTATIGYKAATCTADGHTAGEMCLDCDYKTVQAIKATGHSYQLAQEAVAPTCTEAGAVEYYTCANSEDCGKFVLEGETYVAYEGNGVVDALGHTLVYVEGIAPTCSANGVKSFYYCACQGEVKFEAIELLGIITYVPTFVEDCGHEAHCFGKFEDAEATVAIDNITIAHLEHVEVEVAYKAATCTTDGNTAGTACALCKTVLSGAEVIPATGHSYQLAQEAVAPTCTEAGAVEYYTCANNAECGNFVYVEGEEGAEGEYVAYTGEVVIPAKGHTLVYVEGIAPTCSANGVKSFWYCACQGEVKFAAVELLGIITYIPTYVEDCEHEAHCFAKFEDEAGTVAIDNITIAHLEHVWQKVGQLDPTCTELGYAEGERCALCGETKGTDPIDALGHKLVKTDAKAETCEANGNIEYWTCSVCGNIYDVEDDYAEDAITLEDTVIDVDGKVGHTLVHFEGKEPTCFEAGLKAFDYCTCQGEIVLVATQMFQYTYYYPAFDTDCEDGHVHCNKYFIDGVETDDISIAPKQHKWTAAVEHKPATCTEHGYYAANVCVWCQLTDVIEEIAPRGHELSKLVIEQPATCTETGLKAHYTCVHEEVKDENGLVIYEACEQYFDADKNPVAYEDLIIPALGHKLIKVEAVAPTCFAGGYNEFYVCASECTPKLVPLFDENGVAVVDKYTNTTVYTYVIDPIAYAEDTVCGLLFADAEGTKVITVADILLAHNEHVWNEETLVVTTAPTCVDNGVGTIKCANCNAVNTEYVVEKLADAHDWERADSQVATCTEDGFELFYCKRNCGVEVVKVTVEKTEGAEYYKDFFAAMYAGDEDMIAEAIAGFEEKYVSTGHKLSEVRAEDSLDPTCTEAGYDRFYCLNNCGHYEDVTVEATGHAWNESIKGNTAADCYKESIYAYKTCDNGCGYYLVIDGETEKLVTNINEVVRPATNHVGTLTATPADAPSCTEDGNIAYWYCSLCNKYFSDEACENEITVDETVDPATNHKNAEHYVAVPAECAVMKDGNIEYWYCPDCGLYFSDAEFKTVITEAETVVAWAHSFRDASQEETEEAGVEYIYVAPTCYMYGKKTVVCKVCGKFEYRVLDKVAHKLVAVDAKEDTCTEEGHNAYVYCTVEGCGYTTKVVIDDIKNHDYEVQLAKSATCTEIGYSTPVEVCNICGEVKDPTVVIPALGHTATETNYVAEKASTCMAEGNVAYYACANGCGKNFKDVECSEEIENVVVGKIAHNYVAVEEVAPKCEVDGVKAHYACTNVIGQDEEGKDIVCPCQFVINEEGAYVEATAEDLKIAAPGHDTYKVAEKLPTCTETGWKEYDQCANCEWSNLFENIDEAHRALGHDLEIEILKHATAEEKGLAKLTCKREGCEYEYELEFSLGQLNCAHESVTLYEAKTDAKCGEYNNIAYSKCDDCGAYFDEHGTPVNYEDVFTLVDHVWEEGKELSCTQDGVCTICGKTIPATGHNMVTNTEKSTQATHTTKGYLYKECTNEGCDYFKDETIPENVYYSDQNGDGRCDVCGELKEECAGTKNED